MRQLAAALKTGLRHQGAAVTHKGCCG